jgi:protein-S-isoprenylcysteine O-methyltransferase Ste14
MPDRIFTYLFLIGLIAVEVIRAPHRKRHRQAWRQRKMAEQRMSPLDITLDMIAFAGTEVVPFLYVLTPWFGFAGYQLPGLARLPAGMLGAAALAGAIWLLRRAHADLGRNWSPTLQIHEEHALVTQGVYRHIRHPIYAAVWLIALAQALMLSNWVAGLAGLAAFLPVYLVRVPREERMMLDHFGDEYRVYMMRTGRVIPPVWK